jgi:hypothetical protein
MAKKRIKRLCVRLTTSDEQTLRKLARLAGCSESVLVRDLITQAARAMGLFSPELPPIDAINGAIKAVL